MTSPDYRPDRPGAEARPAEGAPLKPIIRQARYYAIPFDPEAFKRAAQHSIRDELLDRTARAIQETAAHWRAEGVTNIRLERLDEAPFRYGLRLVGDKVKS